jgi:ankyrin repeat protein
MTDTMELSAHDELAIALQTAIRAGDAARLRQLLREHDRVAQAIIIDDRGTRRTLLHIACDWPGHFPNVPAIIAMLIAAGTNPNAPVSIAARPEVAETPLHWAASSDDVDAIDALLDAGADIEAPGAIFTGGTPMSDAVVFAQWNAARRLLARGARTTFWQSAALGLLDPVRECFTVIPPPSAQDITSAFWHACRGGQKETVAYLLERGAELNWIGYDQKTPLDAARESGATELVSWLLTQGAKARRS